MRPYLAYLRTTLRLTARDRAVLFFGYAFPLVLFVLFANSFRAAQSQGAILQVVAMVLVLGILGNGLFGGGMRATMDREAGILRRFKVAPIGPGPILVSSLVTGWLIYLPSMFLFLLIGWLKYEMPWPKDFLSLLLFLTAGVLAFRAVGLIIAAVVNSMTESQVIVQLLYLPMLMLSGATIPLTILPDWVQQVAQFLPSTHLYLGLQSMLVRGEPLIENLTSLAALTLTTAVATFVSMKIFRWEKDDKLKPSAKLWILAVLAPFLLMGMWQVKSKENLAKAKILDRQMDRATTWLIRDARIFTGDGTVIESGAVLLKNGKIDRIIPGPSPEAKALNAVGVEAAGKTLLPGLIDSDVRLALPGGVPSSAYNPLSAAPRALAAYLYSGVTAIAIAPETAALTGPALTKFSTGEDLGAEIFRGDFLPASRVLHYARSGGASELLMSSLAEQVAPKDLRDRTAAAFRNATQTTLLPTSLPAVLGTGSGQPPLIHGPLLHREMELWVRAGAAPADVLAAATGKAAARLGAAQRIGLLKPGYEATAVLVEGNPLQDIAATARIVTVFFKGERVNRASLFEQFK